jgi:hypothetical protein
MTEQRERPQYGEYASVDEQIAAGGHVVEPDSVPTAAPEILAPPVASTRVPGSPPRAWDLPLTVALLVLGGYSTVSSIPGFLSFASTLNDLYVASGYGEYTSTALANGLGIGALVSQSLIYVVTVALAIARLRARKLAFFIPVIGAVVSGVVIFVLVLVAMTSDPALAAWVTSQS